MGVLGVVEVRSSYWVKGPVNSRFGTLGFDMCSVCGLCEKWREREEMCSLWVGFGRRKAADIFKKTWPCDWFETCSAELGFMIVLAFMRAYC